MPETEIREGGLAYDAEGRPIGKVVRVEIIKHENGRQDVIVHVVPLVAEIREG
jgi:hypothetical protein